MLDAHTHILPGVDDGSQSVEESMAMLGEEWKQGIDTVILTPHFYADKEAPERFLRRRAHATRKLEEALYMNSETPQTLLGAEVAYFNGMSRSEELDVLCIGDTQAMLIEMPFCRWNDAVLDEISFLQEYRGIQPIIAHIERYIGFQPSGTVQQLCEEGVWIQANASFFLQWQTAWKAMSMLKKQYIHFIGSDCHGINHRPPNIGKAMAAISKKLGKPAMRFLEYMEGELLEGI